MKTFQFLLGLHPIYGPIVINYNGCNRCKCRIERIINDYDWLNQAEQGYLKFICTRSVLILYVHSNYQTICHVGSVFSSNVEIVIFSREHMIDVSFYAVSISKILAAVTSCSFSVMYIFNSPFSESRTSRVIC